MALSKIQAESMNLADTYAFSGTVSGTSVAGSAAFAARIASSAWAVIGNGAIVPFNNVSTGNSFDTDSVFNTSTYKFTAPATGVYTFWFSIYTAMNDAGNGFTFLKNSTKLNFSLTPTNKYISYSGQGTADHIQTASIILPLTSGDTMAVVTAEQSDYYKGRSQWGGCRLA